MQFINYSFMTYLFCEQFIFIKIGKLISSRISSKDAIYLLFIYELFVLGIIHFHKNIKLQSHRISSQNTIYLAHVRKYDKFYILKRKI